MIGELKSIKNAFNALGGAAGTEADRGTGTFDDGIDTIDFIWYVEDATCSGCTHSYWCSIPTQR
ncbi:hypothetical protein N9164_07520 [Draconibacterium sp.]|nr:hypothetical protein [Draconibacterium sp.]